jgi:hypothetical protein
MTILTVLNFQDFQNENLIRLYFMENLSLFNELKNSFKRFNLRENTIA